MKMYRIKEKRKTGLIVSGKANKTKNLFTINLFKRTLLW